MNRDLKKIADYYGCEAQRNQLVEEMAELTAAINRLHRAEAKNLKRQGVKKGVADIFVPYARHGKYGLYIEMKRRKGGRLRPEQKEFINDMTEEGYATAVCCGAADAIRTTEEYMGWKRPRR